jgi:hypothetical protein
LGAVWALAGAWPAERLEYAPAEPKAGQGEEAKGGEAGWMLASLREHSVLPGRSTSLPLSRRSRGALCWALRLAIHSATGDLLDIFLSRRYVYAANGRARDARGVVNERGGKMAKLRIEDNNNKLIVNAYVNVFKNLVAVPAARAEFLQYKQRRPELLQAATGGAGVVKQEDANGVKTAIDNDNCKIMTEQDERPAPGRPGKVQIPFPVAEYWADDDPEYLDDYASQIHDLYDAGQKKKARQFMYAVMMMTRCR